MYISFKCPHCSLRQGDDPTTLVKIEQWELGATIEAGEEEPIICPTCGTKLNVSIDIQLQY